MHATRYLLRYTWHRKPMPRFFPCHALYSRGLELRLAYKYLSKVESALENATTTNKVTTLGSVLSNLLHTIQSKLDEGGRALHCNEDNYSDGEPYLSSSSTAESFPGMTEEDILSKLNIKLDDRPLLKLKNDCKERMAISVEKGKTELWTSDALYRHLGLLQDLAPIENEAAIHAWIQAFFFRAFAMVPKSEQLMLNIPATALKPYSFTQAGESVNYTVIKANKSDMKRLFSPMGPELSLIEKFNKPYSFFVLEANHFQERESYQILGEMYGWGKRLGKNIVRGAETDGRTWTFIILKMNADGDGATFASSSKFRLMESPDASQTSPDFKVSPYMCDLVSGIVAHWIEQGDKDIGEDDWFETRSIYPEK